MGQGGGEELSPPLLDLRRDLRAVSVLGRGAKGVVFLVHGRHPNPGNRPRQLALKTITKSSLTKGSTDDDARYRRVWFERDVLFSLRHPLLPTLHGFLATDEVFGFAMDRCTGGDLGALRRRQSEGMFSEDAIRFYAAELVLALEHLHGMGVVYRDLKPENVLIQESGHVMLVDFDLSTRLRIPVTPPSSPKPQREQLPRSRRFVGKKMSSIFSCKSLLNSTMAPSSSVSSSSSSSDTSTSQSPGCSRSSPPSTSSSVSSGKGTKSNSFVGTEEYMAPEVIAGTGHDFAVDWWSLGVVLYEMLYGRTPFRGETRKETFYRILTKPPELVGERTALRDLIGRLLEKDPGRRVGCEGIKAHAFFRGVDWDAVTAMPRPPFIPGADSDGDDEELADEGQEDYIDVERYMRIVGGLPGKDQKEVEVEVDAKIDPFTKTNGFLEF